MRARVPIPRSLSFAHAFSPTHPLDTLHRRYSGWFLHFRPGGAVGLPNGSYYSPPCTAAKCSLLFHSQDQTPSHTVGRKECVGADCDCGAVPCGECLWDHRNASLREWLISTHVLGPDGLGNPNVSGFYFDDAWRRVGFPFTWTGLDFNASDCNTGPSEIEQHCLLDMGLSADDVTAVADGWKQTMRDVLMAVIQGGGWAWPMFVGLDVGRKDPDYCKRLYRNSCAEEDTRMTLTLMTLQDSNAPGSFVDAKGDVASFLVARGPYAYLGTGWVGCVPTDGPDGGGNQTYARSEWFDKDYRRANGTVL